MEKIEIKRKSLKKKKYFFLKKLIAILLTLLISNVFWSLTDLVSLYLWFDCILYRCNTWASKSW